MDNSDDLKKKEDLIEKRLEQLTEAVLDLVMPTDAECAPGYLDAINRFKKFSQAVCNFIVERATERVKKHWPDQMEFPGQRNSQVEAMVEAFTQAFTFSQRQPSTPEDAPSPPDDSDGNDPDPFAN